MTVVGINKNIVASAIRDRIELLIIAMQDAIRKVVNDNNSDFNKTANDILDNIISVVLDNNVGPSLEALFNAYDLVGDSAENRYKLNKEIFAFGEQETQIQNNPDLTQSLLYINLTSQYFNLFKAYGNASLIEYGNDEQLNEVINETEIEYQRLRDSQLLNKDSISTLIDIRTSIFEFFTTIDIAIVTQIKTIMKPSSLIAYEQYGSTDNQDIIVSLNKAYNTAFIEGDIKILSESQ